MSFLCSIRPDHRSVPVFCFFLKKSHSHIFLWHRFVIEANLEASSRIFLWISSLLITRVVVSHESVPMARPGFASKTCCLSWALAAGWRKLVAAEEVIGTLKTLKMRNLALWILSTRACLRHSLTWLRERICLQGKAAKISVRTLCKLLLEFVLLCS